MPLTFIQFRPSRGSLASNWKLIKEEIEKISCLDCRRSFVRRRKVKERFFKRKRRETNRVPREGDGTREE